MATRVLSPRSRKPSGGRLQIALTGASILAAALVLSSPLLAGVNTWTSIGPEGAIVRAIVVDPTNGSVIYTTADSAGTYKTTNGGQTWFSINQGLTLEGGGVDWYLWGLAIDPTLPSTLYAAGGGYVFKTSDGGSHWNRAIRPPGAHIYRLVSDTGTPARVFALADIGVFKSEDGAASWTQIYRSPAFFATVLAFAVSPADRNVFYVGGNSQGLSISKDGGQTWTSTGPGGVRDVVIDPTDTNVVYAGTYGYGIFKSTNAGTSWSQINNGLSAPFSVYVRSLALDPGAPSTIYAGTDGAGVFKSSDGGALWFPVNQGLTNAFTEVLTIDPSKPARIYAGFEGAGIFASADAGQSWTPRNTGIAGTRVQQLATHPAIPGTLLAGVYGVGLGRTSNAGATWTFGSNGLTVPIFQGLAVAPTDASIIYVTTGNGLGGLFQSTDGGSNWVVTGPPGFPNTQAVAVDPFSSSTVYCSTYLGSPPGSTLFKSTDAAKTWAPSNSGLAFPQSLTPVTVSTLLISPMHSSVLYAVGDGELFRSSDGGANWTYAQNSPGLFGLGIDASNDRVLYAGSSGIEKSTDAGSTWSTTASSGLVKGAFAILVDRTDPFVVYAATQYQGVFKSVDAGRNWNLIGTGLTPFKNLTSLAIDSTDASVLYVGLDAGGVFVMQQVPPIVSEVSPASGSPSGNTTVSIKGSNFSPGAAVRFGDTVAVSVSVVDAGIIIAVTPPGPAGFADVVVTNPDGQSGILRGGFIYGLAPTPTSTPTVTVTPTIAAPSPAIPTLSEWGFVSLFLTLAGLGYLFSRGNSNRS